MMINPQDHGKNKGRKETYNVEINVADKYVIVQFIGRESRSVSGCNTPILKRRSLDKKSWV